jgi:hypothetical protein
MASVEEAGGHDQRDSLGPYLDFPPNSTVSRFLMNLTKLEAADGDTKQMPASVQQSLAELLPCFDRHLGFAGKAVESHTTGKKAATPAGPPIHARTGLPAPRFRRWKCV